MTTLAVPVRNAFRALAVATLVVASGAAARSNPPPAETQERARIAAANLEDAIVVDCQLPGKLQKLGGMRTYMTPGALVRLSAVDCRARGGEYTLGDLSSGTLSLQRWQPLADAGNAEAQYYVARIYANGMGGVAVDYQRASEWYKRAADQKYSPAVQELGYMYEQGLGVQKDTMVALNLQRQAAGLGDELDYAWKITAAEEAGAKQVATLSERLDASNAELEAMRGKLRDTTNALFRSREALARSESATLDLRDQLAAAKQAPAAQRDDGKIQELQSALGAKEKELGAAQAQAQTLSAQLAQQQSQLNSRMAESQVSSMELNELLSNEKEKNKSLEAELAQANQRLIRSQQELADSRTQYRAEVGQLVAEREDLSKASAKSKDEVAALLSARERELERQQMRVTSLEKALADAKAQSTVSAGKAAQASAQTTAQANAQADALKTKVAALQAQVDDQQKQLKERQQEVASLRAQSQQDRAKLASDMSAQLSARAEELQDKQRRLTAMAAETDALRNQVNRLNEQREKELTGASGEAERARASLRMAQQKLNEQRERLDQLQVEKATEMAGLAKARDDLQRQLSASKQTSDMQMAFLNKDLEARQKDLESKDAEIVRLEARLQEQSQRFNALLAQTSGSGGQVLASTSVGPAAATTGTVKMRSVDSQPDPQASLLRDSLPQFRETSAGSYHALIIGNSLYHYMEPLDTPANDAKEIADLLKQRYNFKVKLLLDATSEQIMTALHEETLQLTKADSLLIYYAGHGSSQADRAFWLGVEADKDTRAGWLEADHIRAKIKEMSAKHVLLVADSCFSGAITHPKTTTIGRGLNETRLKVQWNRRARMVLTSGENTPVADSSGDGAHSVFARYFIQILRQNDNIMSGEMLSYELSGRMLAQPVRVGKDGHPQTPTYSTLQDANHDVGDFFFVPTAAPAKVAAAY
jgi:chromosome segregation ATPase